MLIFIRLYTKNNLKHKYLYGFFLTAFLGIQVHLSILLGFKHLLALIPMLHFAIIGLKDFDRIVVLVFVFIFSMTPLHVFMGRNLWNPSMILAFNFLMLIFIRLYTKNNLKHKYLYGFFLTAFLGIQVHLSILLGFISGLIIILIKNKTNKHLLILSLLLLAYILFFLFRDNTLEQFLRVNKGMFGLDLFSLTAILNLFNNLSWHLFLTVDFSLDHNLFYFLHTFIGEKTYPLQISIINKYLLLKPFFCIWFIISYAYLIGALFFDKIKKNSIDAMELLCVVWIFLGITVLCFYRLKEGFIAFRYGLMFYPMQFLAIALAFNRFSVQSLATKPKTRICMNIFVLMFSILVFIGNVYSINCYRKIMRTSGVSHDAALVFSLPLEYKSQIIDFARSINKTSDNTYRNIHGELVNKMRAHEHDRHFRIEYQGLERTSKIKNDKNKFNWVQQGEHYYITLLTPENMIKHERQHKSNSLPYHFELIENNDLPQRVEAFYYSDNDELIFSKSFDDYNLILPLKLDKNLKFTKIKLKFNMKKSNNKFLRIYFDRFPITNTMLPKRPPRKQTVEKIKHYINADNLVEKLKILKSFEFIKSRLNAKRLFELISVNINGKQVETKINWTTLRFGQQSLALIELLETNKTNAVEILFKVGDQGATFTRIDVFRTSSNYYPFDWIYSKK